jgi:hypothetical protein
MSDPANGSGSANQFKLSNCSKSEEIEESGEGEEGEEGWESEESKGPSLSNKDSSPSLSSNEMKSSIEKSKFDEEQVVSKNSEESDNVKISSDLSCETISQESEFASINTQINDASLDYLMKESLSEKPYSDNPMNPDKLEEGKTIFVKIGGKKTGKKLHHKDEQKISSYLEIDPVDEENNELETIFYENLEQIRGKDDRLFSSKINYTRDGYLSGRILKIYQTCELATIPFELLSKLEISKIPKVLYMRPRKVDISQYYEKLKDNDFIFRNNLFNYRFCLSESDDNLHQSIQNLNFYYESRQQSEEEKEKELLNNVMIDLLDVNIDEFVLFNLTRVFSCLSKFKILMLSINHLSSHMRIVIKKLCSLLRKTYVMNVIFIQSVFNLEDLWIANPPEINTKWVFDMCIIHSYKQFEFNENKYLIFSKIDFIRWMIENRFVSSPFINKDLITFFKTLNNYLLNFRNYRYNDSFSKETEEWLKWDYYIKFVRHWGFLKFNKKIIYKAESLEQSFQILISWWEQESRIRSYKQKMLHWKNLYNRCFLLLMQQIVFNPQFTMDLSLDPKDKIVTSFYSMSMSMWDLIGLIESTSFVSSCIIHVCMMVLCDNHTWRPVIWELDELYLDICNLIDWPYITSQLCLKKTLRIVHSAEQFLKQTAHIEFKDNFQLYLENKETYFNVWNILLRKNWEDEEIKLKIDEFKKHVSRLYCISSYGFKHLKDKINLFTLDDMKNAIEIQRKSSLFLKSTKLVIWNCWVTEKLLFYWFSLHNSFSQVVFEDWVVNVPLDKYSNCSTCLKFVKFHRCRFLNLNSMKESQYDIYQSWENSENAVLAYSFFRLKIYRKDLDLALRFQLSSEDQAKSLFDRFLQNIGADRSIEFVEFNDWDYHEFDSFEEEDYFAEIEESGLDMAFMIN